MKESEQNQNGMNSSKSRARRRSDASTPASRRNEHHLNALFWIFGGFLAVAVLVCVAVLVSPTQTPATVPDARGELPLFGARPTDTPELAFQREDDSLSDDASAPAPIAEAAAVDLRLVAKSLHGPLPDQARQLIKLVGASDSEQNVQLVLKLHERLEQYRELQLGSNSSFYNDAEKKFSRLEREIYEFMRTQWAELMQKGQRTAVDDQRILKEAAQKFGITAEKAISIFIDVDAYVFFREKTTP